MGACGTREFSVWWEKQSKKFYKLHSKLRKDSISTSFSVVDINEKYEILEELGRGNYGRVCWARLKRSQKEFAVKILPKNKENLRYFENELSIMREIDHPNIVWFCEIYVSRKNYYIVMEYYKG